MVDRMNDSPGNADQPSTPLDLRHASTDHPLLVVVPERRLLAIDGIGRPGAADFRLASSLLRTVEDIVRARLRHDHIVDMPRPILEVVWRADSGSTTDGLVTAVTERAPWPWRQVVEPPRTATDAMLVDAIDEARRLGGRDLPLVRVIGAIEGRAVQILHVGDPAGEADSIKKLYRWVAESGFRPRGDLHHLVLADPDVVPAVRARSIFRLPVESEA